MVSVDADWCRQADTSGGGPVTVIRAAARTLKISRSTAYAAVGSTR